MKPLPTPPVAVATRTLLSVVAASLLGTAVAGEPRTWTSADGTKTVEAEFVSARGDLVTLRMANGQAQRYSLDKFSAEDRTWVEEQLRSGAAPAGAAPTDRENPYAVRITGKWERHEDHGLAFRLYGERSHLTAGEGTLFPLVIYLHGRNGNVMDPEAPGLADTFSDRKNSGQRPCFALAPQCPDEQSWNGRNAEAVVDIAKSMIKSLPVDPKRVYLTGYSMGAYGTFHLLAQEPRFFAAAVPVAGGGDTGATRSYRKVPIWVFHGAKDDVVPVAQSRDMVESIERSRGEVKYTEFPEGDHGIGHRVYSDENVHAWLFEQRQG